MSKTAIFNVRRTTRWLNINYSYPTKTALIVSCDFWPQVTLERFLPIWQIAICKIIMIGLEERGKNQSGFQTEVSFQYTGARNWMPTR